ncbi:MAG TPA: formate dehydrogenase accessory sulfurtransferase FdhD, partial [Salinisphaeraceae bacterium]|nr:formate dehydrogenase accessory sulfurtransferase FdhD [Salinisphaeraceae bacterium]
MTKSDQNPWRRTRVAAFAEGELRPRMDLLAVERALEIQVAGARPLITMRTPGADRELVAGLMHGEGVVNSCDEIVYLKHAPHEPDVMRLMLKPAARQRFARSERSTLATSACGVCGKPSFALPAAAQLDDVPIRITPQMLLALPQRLRRAQAVFEATGGLHAVGLFDSRGNLVALREDVGRHNALDKLIGRALLDGRLPLNDYVLLLSGRASYELLQKSIQAGVAVICAVSAPSSHAVQLAADAGATLIGFLRGQRFNVYSGQWRITAAMAEQTQRAIPRSN